MINLFNRTFLKIFDLILWPFSGSHSVLGLAVLSILTGICMLWIFKHISNQEGIRKVKNHLKGHFLELRLYRDDPVLSLKAIRDIFMENSRYILYAVRPMIVMMIPVMIILIQLAARYENRPLFPGEQAICSVYLKQGIPADSVILETGGGIRVETPSLHTIDDNGLHWRICAPEQGSWPILFYWNEQTIQKTVFVDSSRHTLAARVYSSNDLRTFLSPGEMSLRSSGFISRIEIGYPSQALSIAGFHVHWLIIFLIVSVAIGYTFKGIMHVEI
jgi:uncharacterized membrane protein (DUF106 family)